MHTLPEMDFESDSWKPFVETVFHPRNVGINGNTGYKIFDDFGQFIFANKNKKYSDNFYRQGNEFKTKPHYNLSKVEESFLFFSNHSVIDTTEKHHYENSISLNELVVDNHYYTKSIFLDNVLRCLLHFEQFKKLADKYTEIMVDEKNSEDNEPLYYRLPNKYGIKDPYGMKEEEYVYKFDWETIIEKESPLKEKRSHYKLPQDIIGTVRPLVIKAFNLHNICLPNTMRVTSLGEDNLGQEFEKRMIHTIDFVMKFPNAGYSVLPNLLNFIKPGWSINWHMENAVEQEGIIMARPGCFSNVSTLPTTTKESHDDANTQNVNYVYQYNTAIHKMSLNYGSVSDPNAMLLKYITRPTTYTIGPIDFWKEQYDVSEMKGLLYNMEENCAMEEVVMESSPWMPLITAPFISSNYWGGTGQSPVGRFNGHYESEEEFNNRFFNTDEMDIRAMHCYTMNPVWSNMKVNLNTAFVIPPDLLENPLFFLYKYTHFNPLTAICVNQIKRNHNRTDYKNQSNESFNDTSHVSLNPDQHTLMKYISASRGTAFVKMCATTVNQICPSLVLEGNKLQTTGVCKDNTIDKPNYDYKITGSLTLEKFDKIGINHNTFY